jgi:hypothetical protein
MGVQENKAPGTSAQVLIGLILVVAGTAAVVVLTYGLTGAGELSTSVSLGGLIIYLLVWAVALWWARGSYRHTGIRKISAPFMDGGVLFKRRAF